MITMLYKWILVAALCLHTDASPSKERISNGGQVNNGDGFWMASFQTKTSSSGYPSHICGTSILSNMWVVTLASCLVNATITSHQVYTNDAHAYYEGEAHAIESWTSHPDFNADTLENDIAVIKLIKPIFMNEQEAWPIQLPAQGYYPISGFLMSLYGWGARKANDTFHPIMSRADNIETIERAVCSKIYPQTTINEDQFCAKSTIAGAGACDHEMGSSLVMQGQLFGLVNWGQGCGDLNYPYVYTNLGTFRAWIFEVTGV